MPHARSIPNTVAITAAGVISPLGFGWQETAKALRSGRDCISPVTDFDVSQCRCSTAGRIDDKRLAGIETGLSARASARLHRASRMTIAALHELRAQDPGFEPDLTIVGTTSGGMTFGESFFRSILADASRRGRATLLANYSPQKPVLDAQEAVGFRAPAQIIANACASGTNAIGHGFSLVASGRQRRVLCGGYDAISELVFVGFDSLQASTPDRIRPFDRDRTGLVLGEGAAWLALEDWNSAAGRGAHILGKVTGYGLSTDNHHLTQPHPSGIGPRQAMERALASAGIGAREVDYINAHGTATIFNDATEGAAIAAVFGRTPVSSTKSMMGHSLGAAGAIEAVISLIALREQFLPPNINFQSADPAWDLDVVENSARTAPVHRIISNSFGFGGTNASILLEKAA
jgi:3-oxoacyl-[acyl-carrier-protein] synthase II